MFGLLALARDRVLSAITPVNRNNPELSAAPEDWYGVRLDLIIRGHQGEFVDLGLRDENPIERILVMRRQVREGHGVLHGDRKRSVADSRQTLTHVLRSGQR